MKNKLPVILAISVASQCAPFVTEVKGEDIGMVRIEEDTENMSDILEQNNKNDSLAELLSSEEAYLNTDASLLISVTGPAASKASLKKRDKVFVLETEDENSYVADDEGNTGWVASEKLSDRLAEIFDEVDQTMYVKEDSVNVYASPSDESEIIAVLNKNDTVNETGTSTEAFARININSSEGYISASELQDHAVTFLDQLSSLQSQPVSYTWSGAVLSRTAGSVIGPSGKETYYNLDMSTVVSIMRSLGFDAANYPYWVRSDGAKMLGPYIMAAADLSTHPKGSLMEISLGTAIVCDTGGFVYNGSGTKVDVATAW